MVKEKSFLPIWHNITKEEVLASFPLLADKVAVKSEEGMSTVIHKIFEVIKPDRIAEEHYKEGLMLEKNKLPDEAMEAYSNALRINHNHLDAYRRINHIIISQNPHYVSETTIKIGVVKTITDRGYGSLQARMEKIISFTTETLKSCLQHILVAEWLFLW